MYKMDWYVSFEISLGCKCQVESRMQTLGTSYYELTDNCAPADPWWFSMWVFLEEEGYEATQ